MGRGRGRGGGSGERVCGEGVWGRGKLAAGEVWEVGVGLRGWVGWRGSRWGDVGRRGWLVMGGRVGGEGEAACWVWADRRHLGGGGGAVRGGG